MFEDSKLGLKSYKTMYNYFIRHGFDRPRTTKNVYDWLKEKGVSYTDSESYGSSHVRQFIFGRHSIGECWCNFKEELDYEGLMYFADNELLRYCY